MRFLSILIILTSILIGCQRPFHSDESASVHLQKNGDTYQLIRNGESFQIKGASGNGSMSILSKIGGNTIRLYDTLDLAQQLDSAHKYDLAVIVDLSIPQSDEEWFYGNYEQVDDALARISKTAAKYRDHPALLMWCLGNEPLYYDLFDLQFASAFRQMLDTLKKTDPNHPVGSATAFIGDRQMINYRLKFPQLDVILVNTFGSLYRLTEELDRYEYSWDIPFIVSEYGEQGPWEVDQSPWGAPAELNSTAKAQRLELAYREQMPIDHPRFLGSLAFYWGHHQEVTHSWFNFLSEEGYTNAMAFQLAQLYNSPLKGNQPPEVERLLINHQSEYSRFFFKPHQKLRAEILCTDPDGDSLTYEWQLKPEDWFFKTAETLPDAQAHFSKASATGELINLKLPAEPGPYRIFVKITDNHRHFATANLPLYVVP